MSGRISPRAAGTPFRSLCLALRVSSPLCPPGITGAGRRQTNQTQPDSKATAAPAALAVRVVLGFRNGSAHLKCIGPKCPNKGTLVN